MSRTLFAFAAAGAIVLCVGVGWVVAAANGVVPAGPSPLALDPALLSSSERIRSLILDPGLPAAAMVLLAVLSTVALVFRRRRRRDREIPAAGPSADVVAAGDALAVVEGHVGVESVPALDEVPAPDSHEPIGRAPEATDSVDVASTPAAGDPTEAEPTPTEERASVMDSTVAHCTGESRSSLAANLVAMGRQAAEEGDRETTYRLMRQALEMDSRNVDAWIWRAAASESVQESLVCLKTALLLDPENEKAKRGLAFFQSRPVDDRGNR